MGRIPLAKGSRVPACPAFCASKMRRTMPVARVAVTPSGLSSTSQPCTGWPRFFLATAGAAAPGGFFGRRPAEIARHARIVEKLGHPVRDVERHVRLEVELRRITEAYRARHFAAQQRRLAVE